MIEHVRPHQLDDRREADLDGLTRIATAARDTVLCTHHERSCLMSTRVFIAAARYFGIFAKPVPVTVAHLNHAMVQAMDADLPKDEYPPEAWSVGVAGTGRFGRYGDPKGWDGHMIAVADGALIDPSADQFSRPEKGMPLEPFAARCPSGWGSAGSSPLVFSSDTTGSVLRYAPMADPGPWRQGADWSGHKQIANAATADTIRALKSEGFR